jgi:hypothetical protein
MAQGKLAADLTTLEMALIGYQAEREKIGDKIAQIRAQLGGNAAKGGGRAKRVVSAAARARISAAQKKRWAEHRKRKAVKK